ncbi:MAG: hypothetical protein QXT46_00515 [Pyrobaculum sp.]
MRSQTLLILLVALVVWGQWTVSCTKVNTITVDTTVDVEISFSFSSVGPLLGGEAPVVVYKGESLEAWGLGFIQAREVKAAARLKSVLWDRDLEYVLTLNHFKAGEIWELDRYRCEYRYDGALVRELYYNVVVREPPRESVMARFTVGRGDVNRRDRLAIRVSQPVQYHVGGVCRSLRVEHNDVVCEPYRENNFVQLSHDTRRWTALRVNGVDAGSTVSFHGVNATLPNPYYYTYRNTPLSTDLGGDAYLRRVSVEILAEPLEWGEVVAYPPKSVPLYITRVVAFRGGYIPLQPPEAFIIDVGGNSTWVGEGWVWNITMAAVAYRSGNVLKPWISVDIGGYRFIDSEGVVVLMPLGSVVRLSAAVLWRLGDVWIGARPATYLRAVDRVGELINYEEPGARGKLWYSHRDVVVVNDGVKFARFSIAVDKSWSRVVTAWYSPPDPCRQWPSEVFKCRSTQHIFTKVNGTWVGYARVGPRGAGWPITKINLIDWMVAKTPRRCGIGGFSDFMNLVVGDPVLYFWHTYRLRVWAFNSETGDFDIPEICEVPPPHRVSLISEVYGVAQYRNTTSGRGQHLHSTAVGPFYDYVYERVDGGVEHPAGWTDALPMGAASAVSNSTGPWLLYVVPATVCDSAMCLTYRAVAWGPAPPPVPDLVLSGAGYIFLLIYTGEKREASVRVYVERGVVLKPDMEMYVLNISQPLGEVRRVWTPFSGVYVGPGWHIEYRPLSPCQRLDIGARPIYIAPLNWTGPVRVVVEEVGRGAYEFVVFISNDVSLRLEIVTPAPERFTSAFLNTTAYMYLANIPYFHGLNVLGEGGRWWGFRCVPRGEYSQLAAWGDFWGVLSLFREVKIVERYTEPVFTIERSGGFHLVKVTAEGPVAGYAFYLRRNGTWTLQTVINGRCVVLNVSMIYPWDPVLVLPLVSYSVEVRNTAEIWRPKPRLFFKTWPTLSSRLHTSMVLIHGTC